MTRHAFHWFIVTIKAVNLEKYLQDLEFSSCYHLHYKTYNQWLSHQPLSPLSFEFNKTKQNKQTKKNI